MSHKLKVTRVEKYGQVEIQGYMDDNQIIGFYVGGVEGPGRIRVSTSTCLTGDVLRFTSMLGVFNKALEEAKKEARKQRKRGTKP